MNNLGQIGVPMSLFVPVPHFRPAWVGLPLVSCRCWEVPGGRDSRVYRQEALSGAGQLGRVRGAVESPVQDVVHHRRQPDLPLHLRRQGQAHWLLHRHQHLLDAGPHHQKVLGG